MKAVQSQQEECVAVLLEQEASLTLADCDGNTARHLAVLSPALNIVGLLPQHHATTDAKKKEGCTRRVLAVTIMKRWQSFSFSEELMCILETQLKGAIVLKMPSFLLPCVELAAPDFMPQVTHQKETQ
ncbi:ankyrin repeat domain-containing protein 18A-like isoform X2 [Apus apus]|uniref:ankyrin repeat domain-containing protein 18A-like isoform X2 n=1 Tax=Apus apus TaxID=8895 RepID=UPI0021F8378F|nr:ankyrin repeat domain-containing protein 18A-like isoform X2 [Apus apus]